TACADFVAVTRRDGIRHGKRVEAIAFSTRLQSTQLASLLTSYRATTACADFVAVTRRDGIRHGKRVEAFAFSTRLQSTQLASLIP
ncbi:MAG: hypothetical protein IJ796_10170, partial [Lachnospiraceae bacterium]|nr:hypothetical protein [Lachnospiraceae bacterium]